METGLPWGDLCRAFTVDDSRVIDVLVPEEGREIEDLDREILFRLENPTGARPLSEMLGADSRVAIVVDDNTRPTPTQEMLRPLLRALREAGVGGSGITIVFALGAHRTLEKREQEELLGEDIVEGYRVENHSIEEKDLIDLGQTSFGTPVLLNRGVYEADVRILLGLIKPHNQAGYSGGGKSILPGVCGLETIASNHGFKSISHPDSAIGNIEGNPIRRDIEESLELLGPTFIINVVLDYRGHKVRVVAGDPVRAHREGAAFYDGICRRTVARRADICICGAPHPVDINFYQMLNSITAPCRVKEPVINPGGTIIVAGRARNGISDGDFYASMRDFDAEELWEKMGTSEGLMFRDRPALQIFLEATVGHDLRIVVVSEEGHRGLFEEMGLAFYSDLQKAVNETLADYDDRENVLVMPHAPYTIVDLGPDKECRAADRSTISPGEELLVERNGRKRAQLRKWWSI